ncbi:hypothetical protein Tco_0351954 [Tanacetum coccineum]
MRDENPIRTLGYYSKPSHEGYRNIIELLVPSPLSNNIRRILSEQGLDSRLTLKSTSTMRIESLLQCANINDRIDHTLKRTVDYAAGGRLRKMSAEKAWATIEELARYEDEGKVKQLEEYMGAIGSDFMQLSLEVVGKLKEEIRMEENRTKKIKKITRYPNTKVLEPLNSYKFSEVLTEKASFHTPKFVSPKSICVKHVQTIFPSPPFVRESIFGFEPGLDTCNHGIPLSSREVPSFDKLELQPQPLPNCPSLDMIENDWRLASNEVSFLREGLNLPVWPKELENGYIDDKKLGSSLEYYHWIILGGRFNQLSHVFSPLLSKPGEY